MSQKCPICHQDVPSYPRYPRYVCPVCSARAVDGEGRAVRYRNATLLGTGVVEQARDSDGQWEVVRETDDYGPFGCWIDGVRCDVAEAYFGGVVIQAR